MSTVFNLYEVTECDPLVKIVNDFDEKLQFRMSIICMGLFLISVHLLDRSRVSGTVSLIALTISLTVAFKHANAFEVRAISVRNI